MTQHPFYDPQGQPKFIAGAERRALIAAAHEAPPYHRTLCLLLEATGCRLQEALDLTVEDIDFSADTVYLRNIENEPRGVPIPAGYANLFTVIHNISPAGSNQRVSSPKLWPVDRTTASRWLGAIMSDAKIPKLRATVAGIRHGFIVEAVQRGVSEHAIGTWLDIDEPYATRLFAAARQVCN